MATVYYTIAGVVYLIFLIRLITIFVVGDFDVELDSDLGDVFSFKGLTHFLMGFSGWMALKYWNNSFNGVTDYLIAIVLGVIFTIVLYFTYKIIYKLESKPHVKSGKELVGEPCTISLKKETIDNKADYFYLIIVNNGFGTVEVEARSTTIYRTGDGATILDYSNNYYII